MAIAANTVNVAQIGTGPNAIPAGDLQATLSAIVGKLDYAVQAASEAKGEAAWAAQKVGAIHYHLQQIGNIVSYNVPSLDDM